MKQYLETKFAEVGGRLDGIDKRFAEIDTRFEEERAALRQVETNLLTAFHI